jgi:Uncharacterised nucleotidyltransferase
MLQVTKPVVLSVSEIEQVLWLSGLQYVDKRFSNSFQKSLQRYLSFHEPALLINRSINQKCAPFLWDALSYVGKPADDFKPLGLITKIYEIVNNLLYAALDPVIAACHQQGIPIMLIKGSSLLNGGTEGLPRFMYDLDVLVRPPDTESVRRIFLDLGFVHGRLDISSLTIKPISMVERESIEITHYELAALLKIIRVPQLDLYSEAITQWLITQPICGFGIVDKEVYYALSYDVHHNLSVDFNVGDIWYKPRKVRLPGGTEADAQNITDLIWFLSARLYHETMLFNDTCLRLFFDILILMSQFSSEVDWERIQFMVEKYDLQPSLYYTLWHLSEILGPVVPDEIMESCSPCNPKVKRFHDWGDFLPKLLNGCACFSGVFE